MLLAKEPRGDARGDAAVERTRPQLMLSSTPVALDSGLLT